MSVKSQVGLAQSAEQSSVLDDLRIYKILYHYG